MTDHVHEYYPALMHVIAPTGPPPSHTMFYILACECGSYDVFPRCNYDLALPDWQRQFEAKMRDAGLRRESCELPTLPN